MTRTWINTHAPIQPTMGGGLHPDRVTALLTERWDRENIL
jgi:hypothetical protein